jgi:hypothetical protein
MIDLSKPITVPFISGGRKTVRVLFPSDSQWCARARQQKVLRQFLGRGKSQASEDAGSDGANADLLAKIRQDKDGGELTPAEATLVIGKLERARVISVDRAGEGFRIVLDTAIGETEHIVRSPMADEVLIHERESTKTIDGRRTQEIRGFLEPSGALYDSIRQSVAGYSGDVPIPHKVAVVSEVLAQINADDEGLIPEA